MKTRFGSCASRACASAPAAAVLAVACSLVTLPIYSQGLPCGNSRNIPLPDLTTSYRGLDFGLYPQRRTTPPDDHLAIGLDRAMKRIRPLDVNGRPAANG